MRNITILVAMDKNRVIGNEGKVPWKLNRDMKHFAKTTTGKNVVMGRKTYDSLPVEYKPLPKRVNIILTRDTELQIPGCLVQNSVEEVLSLASVMKEVFVIGGAEIYKLFIPHANKMIVTHVDAHVMGDVTFPTVDSSWKFSRRLFEQSKDERNEFYFSVSEYRKR